MSCEISMPITANKPGVLGWMKNTARTFAENHLGVCTVASIGIGILVGVHLNQLPGSTSSPVIDTYVPDNWHLWTLSCPAGAVPDTWTFVNVTICLGAEQAITWCVDNTGLCLTSVPPATNCQIIHGRDVPMSECVNYPIGADWMQNATYEAIDDINNNCGPIPSMCFAGGVPPGPLPPIRKSDSALQRFINFVALRRPA